MKPQYYKIIILILLGLVLLSLGTAVYLMNQLQRDVELIQEEIIPELPTFPTAQPTQPVASPEPSPTTATSGCKRGGCSGQLCISEDSPDIASTCEFRAEYACYAQASCELQPNGQCGFTPSAALEQCLQNAAAQGVPVPAP